MLTNSSQRKCPRWVMALAFVCGAVYAEEMNEVYAPYQITSVPAEAYDRAVALSSGALNGVVKNLSVTPQWIGDQDLFWYQRDTQEGTEYVIVEAATGEKRPAFDHEALSAALFELDGKARTAESLGISEMHFNESLSLIEIKAGALAARCDLNAGTCEALPEWRFDPFQLVSPDGARAVFARNNNLWVRSLDDGEERQLTFDGQTNLAYGVAPGNLPGKLDMIRTGIDGPLFWVTWSPDSKKVLVPRLDERNVRRYSFTQVLPADGGNAPQTISKPIALVGDAENILWDWFVIDLEGESMQQLALARDCHGQYLGYGHDTLWSPDSQGGLIACFSYVADHFKLMSFDAASGETRQVYEETSETFIDLNHAFYGSTGSNIRFVGQSRAIVFSERDGWGHLYLMDFNSGETVRQLTRGDWLVHDLLFVDVLDVQDESERWFYYTAGGREAGRHPYFAYLYRTSLDGARTELLTPEDAHHKVTPASFFMGGANTNFSSSKKYFVDNYSRVDQPTRSVLRRNDGTLVAELEEADASALFARGYVPPEPFKVKAADGDTDIYGVIYHPKNRQPGIKYPVVEQIYGGPQTTVAPIRFEQGAALDRIGGQGNLGSMSEFGFATLVMDARGTPMRSKAFHDYMWNKHHEFAVEDHVAAIRQLGERFPWLDLDRVGVTGHSWGGYSSALAMLRFPDFYKVGVSSAGVYDYSYLYPVFARWTGAPEYEDGGHLAPDDRARPLNWIPHANMVERLSGKMLIVHGDQDENTLPGSTLTLIDALVDANKDFDLLTLLNRDHNYTNEPYFIRRRWDYFVEHLLGAHPPRGYEVIYGD